MSFKYGELTGALICFEALKRLTVQDSLKDSRVYFGQPPVLEYLAEHGHSTQAEIASALGVSPASMAVSIKRMQKSGLVEKITDEKDLRCNKISITGFGREQLDDLHARFDKIDEITYSGFTDEELETLKGFIDRLNGNLTAQLPDKRDICKSVELIYKGKGDEI